MVCLCWCCRLLIFMYWSVASATDPHTDKIESIFRIKKRKNNNYPVNVLPLLNVINVYIHLKAKLAFKRGNRYMPFDMNAIHKWSLIYVSLLFASFDRWSCNWTWIRTFFAFETSLNCTQSTGRMLNDCITITTDNRVIGRFEIDIPKIVVVVVSLHRKNTTWGRNRDTRIRNAPYTFLYILRLKLRLSRQMKKQQTFSSTRQWELKVIILHRKSTDFPSLSV